MNRAEQQRLSNWFKTYVMQFADSGGKLAPMLRIKLEHSRNVAVNAAEIAGQLGLDRPDIRAARMVGLYHDVARFSQYTDHATLRDEHSFDHGRRGAEIMKKCPPLAACSEKDRRRIIAGIRHHNRASLPEGLKSAPLEFVKLARDADKLDIFKVLYSTWKSGELIRNPDIALMVKLDGPVSPAALADIRRKRTVRMEHVKSLADFFVLQLSWVYDLNFRSSYRLLMNGLVIEHIAEVLPLTSEIREQIGIAREHARKQLAGKI